MSTLLRRLDPVQTMLSVTGKDTDLYQGQSTLSRDIEQIGLTKFVPVVNLIHRSPRIQRFCHFQGDIHC